MKLFMDSSTNYLYLALYDNGKEISTLVKDSRNRHSETISDNLEECKKCINFCIKYFTEQKHKTIYKN